MNKRINGRMNKKTADLQLFSMNYAFGTSKHARERRRRRQDAADFWKRWKADRLNRKRKILNATDIVVSRWQSRQQTIRRLDKSKAMKGGVDETSLAGTSRDGNDKK